MSFAASSSSAFRSFLSSLIEMGMSFIRYIVAHDATLSSRTFKARFAHENTPVERLQGQFIFTAYSLVLSGIGSCFAVLCPVT
jgi:hypothetical protein